MDAQNEENPDEMQSTSEDVSQLDLKNLLIKQKDQNPNGQSFSLPDNLVYTETSSARALLSSASSPTAQKQQPKNKKLIDKINEIKKSMTNPFEMYLPAELRKSKVSAEQPQQWNLIKAAEEKPESKKLVHSEAAAKTAVTSAEADFNMIPLRKAFHAQNASSSKKKLKRLAS